MFKLNMFLIIVPILCFISQQNAGAMIMPMEEFKEQIETTWSNNKLDILVKIVIDLIRQTEGNVTVVAYQNLWNPDGTMKEIKTIELVIPSLWQKTPKIHWLGGVKTLEVLKSIRDDEEVPDMAIKMKNDFKTVSKSGLEYEAVMRQFTEDGDVVREMYVDNDDIYVQFSDGFVYNIKDKNIDDTARLEEAVTKLKKNKPEWTLFTSLLKLNDDGTVKDDSAVDPTVMAFVTAADENVTLEMLVFAKEAVTRAVLRKLRDGGVAEEMSMMMTKKFPNFVWAVTKWNGEKRMDSDVFMRVAFYMVGVTNRIWTYDVHGYKK